METSHKYTVAGHTFVITLPEGFGKEKYLSPYAPFEADESDALPLITLKVTLTDSLKGVAEGTVKEILNDEAPYFWIYEDAEDPTKWFFAFSYTKNHPDCILKVSQDYSNAVVYVPRAYAEKLTEFALSNAMMLLYTFRTTPHDTLLVHASVIENDGGGYMFLGRSGTGKSTHARLWLENIEDSDLLNDDNPIIRITDGKAYVYGSPWSGKTPCYKNRQIPLKSVVRLSQAPYNRITRQAPLQAYASLMPSCSCMRWDHNSVEALHKTVEKVIMQVPGWHLECLPDAEAAHTSCNACRPAPRQTHTEQK